MSTGTKIAIVILGVGTLGVAAFFLLRKKAMPAGDPNALLPAPAPTTAPPVPDSSVNNSGTSPKGSTLLGQTNPNNSTPAPVYEPGFPLKIGSKGAYVIKVNLMVGAGIGSTFSQKTEDKLFQRYGVKQIDSKAQLDRM